MLQQPALDSDTAHTNQKLNNITLAQVDGELTRIRNGNARANFSEYNGKLMYTDARGRREVLPVEHRDRVFGELHKRHGYPGVRRFHSLVERQYAGVSRRKLEWWYGSSANNQIHARLKSKTTVRPVYAHDPLRHLQCDLVDFQSRPSGRHKWIFCYIDVFSRYLVAHAQANKEGATCAATLRRVCQQLDLDRLGSVLQSDNDPSFESDVFQDAVAEFGLKHVRSKTYSSTSQGKVERVQLTLRSMIGRWRTATGRSDWHTVLQDLVHTYNVTVHSVTKTEPAIALASGLRGDADMLAYVRHNNFAASKKLMGIDGKPLNVGDRVRVSIFAISSQARRERESRKASEMSNWTRGIFTVKNRSSGTELAFPEYRLREFPRSIFYRYELLGPIDESRLRNDLAKVPPRDNSKDLEDDAVAELSDVILPASNKTIDKDDARFMGASVRREFEDATLDGTVISHVKPVEADLSDEKWVIEYANGKQQAVSPQELLDLLVGEPVQPPKTKAKKATTKQPKPTPKPQAPDPLVGRQVRTWMDLPSGKEAQVAGTIVDVQSRKKQGKKKAGRYYDVSYEGRYKVPNEWIHVSEIKPILI